MKNFILILFYILGHNVMGDISNCSLQGENYGDHRSPASVDQTCYQVVKDNIDVDSQYYSAIGLDIYGRKNLIFINNYDSEANTSLTSRLLISGKQSRLVEVKSVAYSASLKRVFALDIENNAVLSFDDNLGGNISPKRKLYDDSFAQASLIAIDDFTQELLVVSNEQKWLKVFKAKADVDNSLAQHSTSAVHWIPFDELGVLSIKKVIVGEDHITFTEETGEQKILEKSEMFK